MSVVCGSIFTSNYTLRSVIFNERFVIHLIFFPLFLLVNEFSHIMAPIISFV